MSRWLLIILCLFIFACDTISEEYLFDEDDDEYDLARQLATSECVSEAKIFDVFDEQAEFENVSFEVNDIFRINQDANSTKEIYVKVISIDTTSMTLAFNSSTTDLKKVVTFEESDHEDIVSFLKDASCDDDYSSFFEASSLGSSSAMKFEWFKNTIITDDDDDSDSVPEEYEYVTETLTVSASYPLFFYFYNGTKKLERILDEDAEDPKQELTSVITVTKVADDDEDCFPDDEDDLKTTCDFSDTSAFPNCTIEVDADAYNVRDHDKKLISLGGDPECELLQSMDGI